MPVATIDDTKVEDFYTKLVRLIGEGREQEATELLGIVDETGERLVVLRRLALDLAQDRALALAVERAHTRANAVAVSLRHAARSLTNARDLDIILGTARARATSIGVDLASTRACDYGLELAYKQVQFIIKALEKELSAIQMNVKRVRIESPLEPQPDGNGS